MHTAESGQGILTSDGRRLPFERRARLAHIVGDALCGAQVGATLRVITKPGAGLHLHALATIDNRHHHRLATPIAMQLIGQHLRGGGRCGQREMFQQFQQGRSSRKLRLLAAVARLRFAHRDMSRHQLQDDKKGLKRLPRAQRQDQLQPR